MAPRPNISILKPHWQPGHSEYNPIISIQRCVLGRRGPHRGGGGGRGAGEGKRKKNGFDTRGRLAEGGNKFTALSENMAARCVMDHGASDGPTRGRDSGQAHGNRVSQGEGSHGSDKTNEAPKKSAGNSVDGLIYAKRENKYK